MDFLISSEHLMYLARLIKMIVLVEPISRLHLRTDGRRK